jgi:alpha-L-fucosidase
VAWADCEVGVIIHLDVQVFEPGYEFRRQWGYTPHPNVFQPGELDTDQWIAAAVSAGAKYAVLVAKHCSGFSLWPTRAHAYSVANTSWRQGKGDIVRDFVESCHRHGVRPGLYASASCNAYMNVDNPGVVRSGSREDQAGYNAVVEQQLTELWTNYGELFELWFDGGVLPPSKGGPELTSLLLKLQPGAVVFQGPRGCPLLRWVGNERAEAPYPCWSTTNVLSAADGVAERLDLGGDPEGAIWAPAESDMPNRDQHKAFQGGWFWRAGEDGHLYSVEHLLERYQLSVGRNSNLLLGMVIDQRGLVPDADARRFAAFGKAVRAQFATCLGRTAGAGTRIDLPLPAPGCVDTVVLMEDIAQGERVRRYRIEGETPAGWKTLARGTCIGHKRIERLGAVAVQSLSLHVEESVEPPIVREFAAYGTR